MKRYLLLFLLLCASPAYAVDFRVVSGGGGGAPTDATYITQTANGTLTNEQALGSLATGLLKNTTTTGVLSIATNGTDYVAPGTAATGNISTAGNLLTTAGSDRQIIVNRTAFTDYCRYMWQTAGTENWALGQRGDVGYDFILTGLSSDSYPRVMQIAPGTPYTTYWYGSSTSDADVWWNGNGAAVFNEQGNAQNFRVESDTNANMLFVDGTNNRVGIGTASPTTALEVNGTLTVPQGSAAAPSIVFSTATQTGVFNIASSHFSIAVAGTERARFEATQTAMYQNTFLFGAGGTTVMFGPDASHVWAQRNGTNAQGFRLYNTDSGSNDEYLQQQWTSNVLYVGPTYTGSATQRTMALNAGAEKNLTKNVATSFVQVAIASGTQVGGILHYTVIANDATDYQSRSGMVPFAIVNKAGTETCTIGTAADAVAVSTGTLTVSFTADTSPTNAVNLQANAATSLTQTTLLIRYWLEFSGPQQTITPQ